MVRGAEKERDKKRKGPKGIHCFVDDTVYSSLKSSTLPVPKNFSMTLSLVFTDPLRDTTITYSPRSSSLTWSMSNR